MSIENGFAYITALLTFLPWLPPALRIKTHTFNPNCLPTFLAPFPSLAGPAQVLQGWSQPGSGRKGWEAVTRTGGSTAHPKWQTVILAVSQDNVLEGLHSLMPDVLTVHRQGRACEQQLWAGPEFR